MVYQTIYSKQVMEHFKNPRNMGEIKNPDGVGKVGNPLCGDTMHLFIKVTTDKKGREIIKDVKFLTFGCAAAIATSSMITELAKSQTLERALKITRRDVEHALHGLPPIKMHCSNLAAEALHEAIKNYKAKKGG